MNPELFTELLFLGIIGTLMIGTLFFALVKFLMNYVHSKLSERRYDDEE